MKKGTITSESGYDIVYWKLEGKSPGVIHIPSLADGGEKTRYLEEYCRREGRQFIHFHFSSTGESEGVQANASMSDWLGDCLTILRQVAVESQLIVGSGVGGWLMFLVALREPDLVHSLVGIGASPDLFGRIMSKLTDEEKKKLISDGYHSLNIEDKVYKVSLDFFRDASKYNILDMPGLEIIQAPVKLIHGGKDALSPPSVTLEMMQRLTAPTTFKVIDDGDHQLLRPEDLKVLEACMNQCFNPNLGEDSDDEDA